VKIDITAETMKADAAAYIAGQIAKHPGVPDKATAEIIAPFIEDGSTRELVILFMCGFAMQVVETALVLAEVERSRG
jgi:hypothetical protein